MALSRTTGAALVAAVLALAQPVLARQSAPLVLPVSAACISSPFGPRVLQNQPSAGVYHYGIDLPAPDGAPVLAVASGTVIRIQQNGPGGLEMLVQHDGFVGIYSHFGVIAPAFVDGKRTVAAGEKLGVVGRTGISSGPHLYFEMILGGKPIDPAPYLGVPQCNGQTGRSVAAASPADPGGVLINGRRYWQVMLPERQYNQGPQNQYHQWQP
jgi:murein DD-endopeptidase MepM/ murein hydrolase activator NlpD